MVLINDKWKQLQGLTEVQTDMYYNLVEESINHFTIKQEAPIDFDSS